MKLEYQSKSLEYGTDGQPSATRVILGNNDGVIYPVRLSKDAIDKSDSELLELALEEIYETLFPRRAENEKFNLVDEKLAQLDEALSDFKKLAQEKLDGMTVTFTKMFMADEDISVEIEDEMEE